MIFRGNCQKSRTNCILSRKKILADLHVRMKIVDVSTLEWFHSEGISPILIKISFSYSFQYSFLDMHICFCQNLCKFMIKILSYEVTCKYAIYKNPLRTNQANFHAKIYKPCSFSICAQTFSWYQNLIRLHPCLF